MTTPAANPHRRSRSDEPVLGVPAASGRVATVDLRRPEVETPPQRDAWRGPALGVAAVLFLALLVAPFPAPTPASAPPWPAADTDAAPVSPRYQTLGRATRATIVALTANGFVLIDLDTARWRSFAGPVPIDASIPEAGRRLIHVAQHVVFTNAGRVWAIPLVGGTPIDLGPGAGLDRAVSPDTYWVLDTPRVAQQLAWHLRTLDGSELRHATWPSGTERRLYDAGPVEVVAVPGKGVLSLGSSGTWRTVATGRPVAAGETIALVEACEAGVCRPLWFDIASGAEVSRDLPTEIHADRSYRLSPSGTHVLEVRATPRGSTRVSAYGESTVRSTACGAGWRTAVWSADESLLVCYHGAEVSVSDLVAGTVAVFDLETPALGVAIVPTDLAVE